jgi:hypothetical protein
MVDARCLWTNMDTLYISPIFGCIEKIGERFSTDEEEIW